MGIEVGSGHRFHCVGCGFCGLVVRTGCLCGKILWFYCTDRFLCSPARQQFRIQVVSFFRLADGFSKSEKMHSW